MRHLLRLRVYIYPYKKQIILALLSLLLTTAINLAIPAIIQQVIDAGLGRREAGFLLGAALLILVIGSIRAGLLYVQRYLSEWIASHIGFDLRNRLYDHIQHLSFSYHDHAQTGQLISRTIEDVRSIERFTGYGLVELLHLSLLLVGIIVLLFIGNPRLAAISLLPMIPLVLITTNFGQKIGEFFWAVDNALGELSARLQENVTGVQVVRAFAREPHEIQRFDRQNRILYDARVTVISEWSKIMPTSHLLVTLGTILILWFGGRMVLQGEMTIGEVVAFNSYLLMLASPAQQLTWLVNLAGEAVAGVRRASEILDHEPEIKSPPEAIRLPPLSGRVEFRDVCFKYRNERAHALADIDLTVEPNQLIALIGPTGSGKTSLVNLIPRFYDVSEGAVLVDGIDVRQADLVSLRRQIGIVLQTSLLFSTTLRENLAYGRPDASEAEIVAAARAAQAHDFISSFTEGYDTIVGERGVTLSGGQRQRVAIARALLMDPRILILDDSTSSVDTQTERLIQLALDRLMEGRTTFVIAHRLSTVQRADLILVMEAGRIVERGVHAELLARKGLYREIYELQLRDQERFRDEIQSLKAGPYPLSIEKPREIETE
ncbi:MAG TPA: ABC transporter ATP-binding protein [Anaerolineales bacterium]|nr:ABC transporter ATP-binding protein [Anaerolineales bacterium]